MKSTNSTIQYAFVQESYVSSQTGFRTQILLYR